MIAVAFKQESELGIFSLKYWNTIVLNIACLESSEILSPDLYEIGLKDHLFSYCVLKRHNYSKFPYLTVMLFEVLVLLGI